jgi:LysR family transcriptional regulator, nod-box dependent transcriptional activator
MTLKEYLTLHHISVEAQPTQEDLIDRSLGESGLKRRVAVHLLYFLAAIHVLETTDLVLTMPARIATPMLDLLDLPHIKAPKEIRPIHYSMVWHPRYDSDQLHSWLRDHIRQITSDC